MTSERTYDDDSDSSSQAENIRDYGIVGRLFHKNKANLKSTDWFWRNRALRSAAGKGHSMIMQLLLAVGADPNSEGGASHQELLWRASSEGHARVVELLLQDEKTCLFDFFQYTPLHVAARKGHDQVVAVLLLDRRIDPNKKALSISPLSLAASEGHLKVVKLFLDSNRVKLGKDEHMELLLEAARKGHSKVVALLVEKGEADSSPVDQYELPLREAAKEGHVAVAEVLLNNSRTDPDSKSPDSKTPLIWAAENGHRAVVELLLKNEKVSPHSRDCSGKTPLCWAAENGHHAVVELLLETGEVSPELRDGDGKTPLCWAAQCGHHTVVELLLKTGLVDPNSKDLENKTPLWWAAINGHQTVVERLLKMDDIDVNSSDTVSHRTPLASAARCGSHAIVNLLLNIGNANRDSEDLYGVPPLWWAVQNGDHSNIDRFFENIHVRPGSEIDINNEIDRRCISHWLLCCDKNHNGCREGNTQNQQIRSNPRWVIDTEKACIVPGKDVSQYVALSYVWSNGQESALPLNDNILMLNTSNLEDFQRTQFFRGPPAANLPRVIKDAMELVRKIDVRYLWVDRLCIIQDSQEKQAEVERMDEIYSYAYLVIIAAASSGLFGESPRNLRDQSAERLYGRFIKTRWATRGWTYQEHILSRRAVIFMDGGLFWDCKRSLWDKNEILPGIGRDLQENMAIDNSYYNMAHRISTILWPNFWMYLEMISLYNGRDFTYPQDVLPAISGVLNLLARSFSSGFVGGIPRLFLDNALLWQPATKARRRHARQDLETTKSSANLPSWSWCGWQCSIEPYSLRTGLAYIDDKECQFRASTWRTRNLVQWSVLSDGIQSEQRIDEPQILQAYKDIAERDDAVLPDGWTRHADGQNGSTYFRHTTDPTAKFKHPVPIKNPALIPSPLTNKWPFLACETSRAFFTVGSIVEPFEMDVKCEFMKISVFDLPRHTEKPERSHDLETICLKDKNGEYAGQLQRMDYSEFAIGEEVELIAISSGSVDFNDLSNSFRDDAHEAKFFRRYFRVAAEDSTSTGGFARCRCDMRQSKPKCIPITQN